ncbi:MAG: ATP-binding protein, partial [Planctomycetes bacterium]|nr:ATP-binding protein [Planctomycetota bacterium]
FMLIASLNPCPCGYRNDPRRDCHCTIPQVERYMAKISGPLLDRIDIHIEVPAVPFKELSGDRNGTSSSQMHKQVLAARAVQSARFLKSKTRQNAQMTTREIREHCRLSEAGTNLLRASIQEMGLSARAHDKVHRVARTIADLDGQADIMPEHISEAVNYRILDRRLWS